MSGGLTSPGCGCLLLPIAAATWTILPFIPEISKHESGKYCLAGISKHHVQLNRIYCTLRVKVLPFIPFFLVAPTDIWEDR